MAQGTSPDDVLKHPVKLLTARSINEYLGVPESWPVVERLQHGVVLMPNAQDIRRAKRQDPRACALHNAACRSLGVENAAIGALYAYICLRDSAGRDYIARLQATPATRKAIQEFDRTGKMPPGGFSFVPVAKSQRLEYVRKHGKSYVRNYPGRTARNAAAKQKYAEKHRRKGTRAIPRVFTEDEK